MFSFTSKGVTLPNGSDPVAPLQLMRMNLYGYHADNSTYRIDGTISQYGDTYSDEIDTYDGRKMTNPGANACLLRENVLLVVERRHTIESSDTIFYKMWGLQQSTYQLCFVGVNLDHPGLTAVLEDNYNHSSTPLSLNDTSKVNFVINSDPESATPNRFRIIFKAIPVIHFTPIQTDGNKQVFLNWSVINSTGIKNFVIQKSTDGNHFSDMEMVDLQNPYFNKYEWADHFPTSGLNYYRIKTLSANGKSELSEVVSIKTGATIAKITLFPNPASAQNMNLELANQQAGNYKVRLYNSYGQAVMQQSFDYSGGNGVKKLESHQTFLPGIYHLQIIKPSGEKQDLQVVL